MNEIWLRRDSNPQPRDFESRASAELGYAAVRGWSGIRTRNTGVLSPVPLPHWATQPTRIAKTGVGFEPTYCGVAGRSLTALAPGRCLGFHEKATRIFSGGIQWAAEESNLSSTTPPCSATPDLQSGVGNAAQCAALEARTTQLSHEPVREAKRVEMAAP